MPSVAEQQTLAWQRRILLSAVIAVPVIFWRPAADPFQLPKATVVAGAALLVLLLWVYRVIVSREVAVPVSPWPLALAGFLGIAIAATVASSSPAVSFWGEQGYSAGLLLYASVAVIALSVLRVADLTWSMSILRAITVAAGIAAAYGVLQAGGADPFDWQGDLAGVTSTLGQQNFTAGLLGAAVPATVGVAIVDRGRPAWRVVGAFSALLAIVALSLTGSFQGPAAASVSLGLLLLLWTVKRISIAASSARRRWMVGLAGGVVVVLALAFLGRDVIVDQVADGLRERRFMWEAARDLVADRPVLGTGLDTFSQHFFAYRPPGHGARYGFLNAEAPHSVPLAMFTSGGALLGLAYLVLVGIVAWRLVAGLRRLGGRAWELLAVFGAVWVGYQVQSLVSIDVPPLALLHFISAAVIVSLAGAPEVRRWGSGAKRRKGPRASVGPGAVVFLTIVGLTGAWWLLRPVRADVDAAGGFTAANDGQLQVAAKRFERATDLAPYRGLYWFFRAGFLAQAGEMEEARRMAAEASARDEGNSRVAVFAAELAAAAGDEAAALDWYSKALEWDPHNRELIASTLDYLESVEGELSTDLRGRLRALERMADGDTA